MDAHLQTNMCECETKDSMLLLVVPHRTCFVWLETISIRETRSILKLRLCRTHCVSWIHEISGLNASLLLSNGIHKCTVRHNLSIWYGRHGFCSASSSPNGTGPNDGIYPVPIRHWSIPAPWTALPLGYLGNLHESNFFMATILPPSL